MRDLLQVWVGFRAVNVTGRVGSVRAVSNDFGFGPGTGFSLKPVQTSTTDFHTIFFHTVQDDGKLQVFVTNIL